jgi:hypothetical protein
MFMYNVGVWSENAMEPRPVEIIEVLLFHPLMFMGRMLTTAMDSTAELMVPIVILGGVE